MSTPQEKKNMLHNMLNDVINHFGEDPVKLRATNGGLRCFYTRCEKKHPNNIGCAIGMYLSDEVAEKLDKVHMGNIIVVMNIERYRVLLPKWMQEMPEDILYKIQKLHDNAENWLIKGLSNYGKEQVKLIKKAIDNL